MTEYVRIVPINYVDTATSVAATSEATRFPVTNLQSNIRDRSWRSSNQSAQTITGTFPFITARTFSAWGLWPGAFLYGNFVQMKIWDGTDPIFDSGLDAFTRPSGIGDWLASNAFGTANYTNAGLASLAAHVEYFTPVASSQAGPTFELTVQHGGSPNGAYFEARRLWVGEYVDAPFPADASSFTWRWITTSRASRAFGGSLRRLVGSKVRAFRFDTLLDSEADRQTWANLLYFCEPGKEVVISLFQTVAKQHEDFTILGSVVSAQIAAVSYGVWKVSLEVEES
jgi:hypothetical protein